MDNERVLEKIEELMEQRGYTKYKLAQLSGIQKSTITTMFKKRSTVSIQNLSLMCRAFNLTLTDFFAMLEEIPKTGSLRDFPAEWWESLTPEKRRQVTEIIKKIAELDLNGIQCKTQKSET